MLVLGMDGATFDVILPMVEKGELPNFEIVMKNGAWGELKSTIPPSSGPAWASFMTGMKPANHGIFDFVLKKPGSYETCVVNSTYVRSSPFWRILGSYGLKVGIINVMVTYPPQPVNGFLITGGLTPPGKDFTYPKSLAKEIMKKFGDYPIFPVGGLALSERNEEEYVKKFLSSEEKRMAVAKYLMETKDWDFFMVMYEAADPLQHELWKYLEKNGFRCGSAAEDYVRSAIPNFYKKIDYFLGELLDRFGKEITICIMSDHGFGPLKRYLIVNNFLIKIGMLKLKHNFFTSFKRVGFSETFNLAKFYLVARKLGVSRTISLFRGRIREKALSKLTLSLNDIDWSRTRAYAVGTGGHIYLNVKGREPRGIVEQGQEYKETREFIIQMLESLKDPKTGEKVVESVYRREEAHKGRFFDRAPDISLTTRAGYASLHKEQFVSPKIFIDSPNSGAHRTNGICIFHGLGIERGTRIMEANIYDLAPTILHIFGLPVPKDMNGRVVNEVFSKVLTNG